MLFVRYNYIIKVLVAMCIKWSLTERSIPPRTLQLAMRMGLLHFHGAVAVSSVFVSEFGRAVTVDALSRSLAW